MNKDIIELAVGQTAQPETCGSCKFFYRQVHEQYLGEDNIPKEIVGDGNCHVPLPPQIAIRSGMNDDGGEYIGPSNRTTDTKTCVLWKPSGKVYIERRLIKS